MLYIIRYIMFTTKKVIGQNLIDKTELINLFKLHQPKSMTFSEKDFFFNHHKTDAEGRNQN